VKDYIEERALEIAKYIISEEATVRQAASIFGVSKSTVHKDVTERLPKINPLIATMVKQVLEKNKAERHIRGGKATQLKYKQEHEEGQEAL
jgi:putative DeoR family transcriptional regulator (stage III sporulation protein D)